MLIGVISLALGLWMLFWVKRGWAVVYWVGLAVSLYFSIWGIAIIVTSLPQLEDARVFIVCGGLGFIFVGVGLWLMSKVFICNHRIEAVYRGCEEQGKGKYSPCFAYTVSKRKYLESDGISYRKQYLEKRFIEGCQYKIWVNEKNPKLFIIRKRVSFAELAVFVLGVWIFAMPFIYLL